MIILRLKISKLRKLVEASVRDAKINARFNDIEITKKKLK